MADASWSAERAAATTVVVPAFREERVVRGVAERLAALGVRVVVVDDASDDGTAAALAGLPVTVLRHGLNLGQGAALQTGITWALQHGARYVVTFDADGQHEEADVPALVAALADGGHDVALGSRFLGAALDMPRSRRRLLRFAVWFTRRTTGLAVTDAHNGLRAFTADAARRLRIRQSRMAHASEILAFVAHEELRWTEVPTTVRYTEYSRAKGQSALGAIDILYELCLRRFF